MPPTTQEPKEKEATRVVFLVPADLIPIIEAEAEENGRTRTAELIRALRAYYKALGKWPPQP